MGRKRKSPGGHGGTSSGLKMRGTVGATATPTTEIKDESPPYSELDEPQVEGYIKVELDPDLDPGPDIHRQVSIYESSNQVLVSDPDIDIGDVDVKVLRFPEDELGGRDVSLDNFGVDATTLSNEQRSEGTGSTRVAQILPGTEAATSDPETQQRLEKLKKQIKNADRKIEGLLGKIDEKKEEAATLRTMPVPFKTRENDSMLHLAVSQHDEKAVLDLIEKGTNVNVKNNKGETPLHKAVSTYTGSSSLRIIKILIEKGSNLRINGRMFVNMLFDGTIPLAPPEFHDLAEFMIGRNLAKLVPLQLAVLKLDVKLETFKMLHAHGVSFKDADGDGESILGYAMRGNRSSTVMASLIKVGADYRSLNKNKESVLFYGVIGDDMAALKYFLTLDLDVNATNDDGDTPLQFAMKSGNKNVLQIAQLFISNKANVNTRNHRQETPLHAVAQNVIGDSCPDLIKLLIDSGTDAFAKDTTSCTFLHDFLQNCTQQKPSQFHKIVEYLTEKQYIKLFDEVSKDGMTLLHLALQNINMEASTLSILHKQGTLELKYLPGSVITGWLNRITMSGNVKALKFLVTELELDVAVLKNFWENTPLHQAALDGSRNVIQEVATLINEKNGSVNVKNKGGCTPFGITMERQNMMEKENCGNGQSLQLGNDPQSQPAPITTSSVTLAANTSLEIVNKNKRADHDDCERSSLTGTGTPDALRIYEDVLQKKLLKISTLKNDLTSVEKEVGRLITLPGSWDTELNLAVMQGDEQAVMDLVQNGANVNGRDDNGNTPLYNAARCTNNRKSLNITKFLIENGADVYALNQSGCPFFHPGMTTDYFHELALILAGRNADSVFNTFVIPTWKFCDSSRITGFQEIMRMVEVNEATLSLLRNVDFNAVDEDKLERSVLWYAVTGGRSLAMIKNLVKYGANPTCLTKWKETLLFGAAEAGRIDLFQHFLSLGLDINAVNKCGNTPLHYVMKSEQDNQLELTKFLIRNGSNPNLKNNYYETPLHFAAARIENNDTSMSVIKELLDNGAFPFDVDKQRYSFLEHLIDKSDTLTPSQFHDVVQYIIEKNYTALFKDVKHMDSPISTAVRYHVLKYDTLSLLHENGLLPNVQIHSLIDSSAYCGNAEGLKILIQFRRDMNNDDGGGRTVLQEVDEYFEFWSKRGRKRVSHNGKGGHKPRERVLHRRNCCGQKCQWPSSRSRKFWKS